MTKNASSGFEARASSLTTDKQQFGSYLKVAPYQTGGKRIILVPVYYDRKNNASNEEGQVATTKKFSSEDESPSVAAMVGKLDMVIEDDEESINVVINSKGLVMVETGKERATKGINSHNIKNLDFSLPKKWGLILIENDFLSMLVEIDDDINFGSISRHPTTTELEKVVEPMRLAETARLLETETLYYHKSSILDTTLPKISRLGFKDNKSP